MGFFDFFFGKKDDKKQEQKQPTQQLPQKEQGWVYELILQYLTSPIWKITISEFQDNNCIVFDDEEENKIEYQNIHKKFKKLIAELVDNMVAELLIDEETLAKQVEAGLKHPKHKAIFEQLLIIDNFLVFKKLMIKRNKELELEALKELEKQDAQKNKPQNPQNQQNMKILELEKEKAEIEHAIALSKAVEEERLKMMSDDERQLQDVMRQSLIEYKNGLVDQQKELTKKEEELKRLQLESQKQQPLQIKYPDLQPNQKHLEQIQPVQQQQQQQVNQIKIQATHKDDTPTPSSNFKQPVQPQPQDNNPHPTMSDIYKVEDEGKQEIVQQPIQQIKQQLPPIEKLPSRQLPPLKQPVIAQVESVINFDGDVNEQDKAIMQSQIDKLKSQKIEEVVEQKQESIEDRKKRLLAQREALRKIKQEESEKVLQEYKVEQQVVKEDNFDLQKKNTQTELQRRRELLEQKKRLLQKQKEEEDVDLM